ncbi:hypothetical protein JNW90_26175 [Micromonospora sp. STR1s_5]|nr:hypothetical protein [Micromonospora sp. STR1s_5]
MVVAGRGEALPESEGTAIERQRPEVELAVQAYLKLGNGDPRQALALAVQDAISASQLVSRGFARWGQPDARTW